MEERLEAIVSGKVQGVMFRDFVQRTASGLKLYGEVKNLSDGTVQVIAEGSREKLNTLVEKLHRGPLFARVEQVMLAWKPASAEFSSFKISYER